MHTEKAQAIDSLGLFCNRKRELQLTRFQLLLSCLQLIFHGLQFCLFSINNALLAVNVSLQTFYPLSLLGYYRIVRVNVGSEDRAAAE